MLKIAGLFCTILLNAVFLNHCITSTKMIKVPSYIITFVLLILSLPLIHLNIHWNITISLFLLSLIYNEIIRLYDISNIKSKIFKNGFFLSLMGFINLNLMFFYIMILILVF